MDEKMLRMLQVYSWRGNIRELQNVIERWAIVSASDGVSIDESWLPGEERETDAAVDEQAPDGTIDLRDYVETIERNLIARALTAVGGKQRGGAHPAGP